MCGTVVFEYSVRARKRHRCCACWLPINPGDDYIKSGYKDGADFNVDKWHQECRHEFSEMLSAQGEDCGNPGETWERVPDYLKARYKWQLREETCLSLQFDPEDPDHAAD